MRNVRFTISIFVWNTKTQKPQKIVEVGVAHGGTTCVIIQSLKMLGHSVEIHSIDITEECYSEKSKKTGYAVDMTFDTMPNNISHKWHLGKTLPQVLDSIGKDIDIIILDTTHSLPGEMLDFLAAFPYLSQNAVVILHDIILNQTVANHEFSFATRIVYDVVVAEKIIADGIDIDKKLPNIGAFMVNNDTEKYIEKCFSSLAVTWTYDLSNEMLEQYMKVYSKFYDNELIDLFKRVVSLNRDRMKREKDSIQDIINFNKYVDLDYKLVLLGGGDFAERISHYLKTIGRKVDAYVISDNASLKECRIEDNIYHFSDLPFSQSECNLVIAMSEDKHEEVLQYLKYNKFHKVYPSKDDNYSNFINYIDKFN